MKWKLNIYGVAKELKKGEICGHSWCIKLCMKQGEDTSWLLQMQMSGAPTARPPPILYPLLEGGALRAPVFILSNSNKKTGLPRTVTFYSVMTSLVKAAR